MSNHFGRLLALVVLAATTAACQSIPAVASPSPIGSGPLVSVTVRGGECPEGACGGTTVIEHDGRVRQTAPAAAELGRIPGDILIALEQGVKATDFDVVRARPFTGECPVNFDGQETIFEFGAPGGTERVATCETDIDPTHPLFVAVEAAMASVVSAPS